METNNTGKTVTYSGDFANGERTGVIVSDAGGWMRIEWSNGQITMQPSGLVSMRGWTVR